MESALTGGGAFLAILAAYALGAKLTSAYADRWPSWLRRTLTVLAFVWLAVIVGIAAFVLITGR